MAQRAKATQKQSTKDVQSNTDSSNPEEATYSWPPIPEFPDRPVQALLIFHGLMGFAYNALGFCEIGMHSKAPQHECTVTVYEVTGIAPRTLFTYNFGSNRYLTVTNAANHERDVAWFRKHAVPR